SCVPSIHSKKKSKHMDSSLVEVWQAAQGSPYFPAVGKDSQFLIAIILLLSGLVGFGTFSLKRSFANIPILGIPSSLAIAYVLRHTDIRILLINWLTGLQDRSGLHVLRRRCLRIENRTRYPGLTRGDPASFGVILRCINFSNKVHVEISEGGIRFAADNARVMQGCAVIDKTLFSSYEFQPASSNQDDDEDEDQPPPLPSFQINLGFLLETLQILGSMDVARKSEPERGTVLSYNRGGAAPFSDRALGLPGTCTLTYAEEGAPLSITIEESGVKTTANLVTYLPEIPEEIPFDRSDLAFKIIMQPRSLLDALADLATMSPEKLLIEVAESSPYLTLSTKGGDYGSSSYDFSKGRHLLETHVVHEHWVQSFKYDFIKAASEAMRIGNKVSFRGDRQGVLSLQFMVEVEGAGSSFLDFKFVPFTGYDGEDDEEGGDDVTNLYD
ncbi:hypothetical protein jhhlp_000914, partial [Lomentospora prolificans]